MLLDRSTLLNINSSISPLLLHGFISSLAIVGVNESERHNIQTIYVTVTLYTSFEQCGQTDDISHTTNYAYVSDTNANLIT